MFGSWKGLYQMNTKNEAKQCKQYMAEFEQKNFVVIPNVYDAGYTDIHVQYLHKFLEWSISAMTFLVTHNIQFF